MEYVRKHPVLSAVHAVSFFVIVSFCNGHNA